jgi:DNA repair protein RadC
MKKKQVVLPLPYEVRIQYIRPAFKEMASVTCSHEAYTTITKYIGDLSLDYKEYFWLMTLAHSNRLLGISLISIGSVSGTVVSVAEILQTAVLSHASTVVLVHNHPSGNLAFSKSDERITRQVELALGYLDILLLDHLVISSEGYISMGDEGII